MIELITLSILQGIAEFLPISSSGHIVIAQKLLGIESSSMRMNVFLHLGTLFAIFIFYRTRIIELTSGLFSVKSECSHRKESWDYFTKIILSVIPAVIVYFAFEDFIDSMFINPWMVGMLLMLTGAVLILTKYLPRGTRSVSRFQAVVMGVFQAFALLPGVSRSGMTIAAARAGKVDGEAAAEFSFLMSAPLIMGATILEGVDIFKTGFEGFSMSEILIATTLSAFVGYFSLKFLVATIKGKWFWVFGPYCIAAGLFSVFAFSSPEISSSDRNEKGSRIHWEFPRLGSSHEGIAFADGVTGVLVWGGYEYIHLTVGRADMWDHRGGYPWTEDQSYSNIVSAVRAKDKNRLLSLFDKKTPEGEPRNPFMLPLGRVTIKIPGVTLKEGFLDPKTGLGEIVLEKDGGRFSVEIAMSKKCRTFALRFPEGIGFSARPIAAIESDRVKKALLPLGYAKAEYFKDDLGVEGFKWAIPEDDSASLGYRIKGNVLALQTQRAEKPLSPSVDYDAIRKDSEMYWQNFWMKSARIKVPDSRIQSVFEYGMYRFGAMTDPDGIPAGLQGPWLEDDKLVPWNGDYHFNINVQECYSPAFRGGHFENLMPLFKMVLSWRSILRDNAKKFCGIDNGYVLPHSVDDRGVCIGGFWTGTIDHTSTAWVATMMYRYVKYSGDLKFLRDSAFDFMKGALNVYLAMFEDKDGVLSLPVGPSPEWGGADFNTAVGRNPSFQLAAAHRLARDLVSAAERLGEAPDPRWLDMQKRLPLYTLVNGRVGLFENQDLTASHRHHSHMALFYPFDIIDIDSPQHSHIVEPTYWNWIYRGTGEWSGWCVPWASILHTHVGNRTAAVEMLQDWVDYFCNPGHGSRHNAYRPGFSVMGRGGLGPEGDHVVYGSNKSDASNGVTGSEIMQMDGQCAAVTAIMELMAHEVNGKVEFFRGCPEYWKEVEFENLALSDGTRVSGKRSNGKISITRVK